MTDLQAIIPRLVAASVVAWPRIEYTLRSVAIVVLGDIGRRSTLTPALEKAQIRYLPEPPDWFRVLPFLVSAPLKVLLQVLSIFIQLFIIPNPPEFIPRSSRSYRCPRNSANPPSIPTLAIVWLVGRIRGSKVIIDWHNLGYSILAMRFERTFGQTAYAHLFVTEAMRNFLVEEWDLQGIKVVLHDRPPRRFHKSTPQGYTTYIALKLAKSISSDPSLRGFLPAYDTPYSTAFTATNASSSDANLKRDTPPPPASVIDPIYSEVKAPFLREDRPALLVSSTSWTEDEDFSILLSALGEYEIKAAASNRKLPKLLVILTGKGPLRDKYMSEVGELQKKWNWVRCVNRWLEAEDYPVLLGSISDRLLGAADLGISLHASSSGLDLPMKVVDMFGCALPVCALDFSCLDELVKDGKNGLVFKDAPQLAQQMETLLTGFPDCPRISHRSPPHELPDDIWETWDENWARYMRPLILRDVRRNEL
ncbi:mannosyltransferase [Mycena filopes]|nr:mannosyltransferase [Mycena filopes]